MSELQALAQLLHAPGATADPSAEGTYLIYPEGSSITVKHYNAGTWGDEESVDAQPTRPNSTVAALFSPESRSIYFISRSSTLGLVAYDDDERDWVVSSKFPNPRVHAEGNVAAAFDPTGKGLVFFQDPSGSLIQLDSNHQTSKVPVSIRAGSPIAALVGSNGNLHVFYIASDNHVHFVTKKGSNWSDAALGTITVEEKLKQLVIAPNAETGLFEAYVLTSESKLYQITAGEKGAKELMGSVGSEGKFSPTTDAECCWCPCRPVHYCWRCCCYHSHWCC